MNEIREWYKLYQKSGTPNEDARMILPNACETSLYLSCNLRELIHICNERLCSRAQWEIRELVKQMRTLVTPELHFMLVPKCASGRIICNSPCGRKADTNE
jgi:thymidylate synthase (FAD)